MGKYFPALPSRQLAQMGDVDDNPVHLCAEETFWSVAKPAFLWGRSSGSSGEHPQGLALDFSVLEYGGGVNNPGPARAWMGNKVANWLWANRKRLGVWYVIWDRRIISTNRDSYAYGDWVAYNGWNPHTDHVHVSFYRANIYQPPALVVPEPEPQPEEDVLNAEDRQWIAGQITAAVTDAVNQSTAKAAAAVQASEQRIRDYVRQRSTAHLSQENADTYGFGGKTTWQDSGLISDIAWRTRDNQRRLSELAGESEEAHARLLAQPPIESGPTSDEA